MFEWDPIKNHANIEKHGIDFEDVIQLFSGRYIEMADTRKDYGEERFQALGVVNGYVLYVVYTPRGNKRRLISARLASQEERKVYYGKD